MWLNYFEHNKVKYYTGTVFITNDTGRKVEATFIGWNPDQDLYVYQIDNIAGIDAVKNYVNSKLFYNKLISITGKVDNRVHSPTTKQLPDKDIKNLPLGWIWYIFLMALSTIFKGRIVMWIVISIIFFKWRAKRINEEGTYVEW